MCSCALHKQYVAISAICSCVLNKQPRAPLLNQLAVPSDETTRG